MINLGSGDLVSSNQQTLIRNTIDDLVNKRFSKIKINEATSLDESNDEISTFHLDLDGPIGMISFFYGNPNPKGDVYWVECNGLELRKAIYPEFFKFYDEITGTVNNTYTLPNIVGRTIVGAGNISNPSLIENTSRNYGSNKPFHHNQSNVSFLPGETGGYDVCPADNVKTLTEEASIDESSVPVCINMSNMPPHIYMTTWMKIKNKKFKLSF